MPQKEIFKQRYRDAGKIFDIGRRMECVCFGMQDLAGNGRIFFIERGSDHAPESADYG